ncbi:MAG TPA: cation:proton antiporter, partial [Gemmatimonadaceae bacterium]|nr:cation:proton antiporter [Gemmatimonadaceae bacterium]
GVGQIAWISTAAIGFVVLALVFGARIVRPVFRAASRLPIEGVVGVLGIVFAFALAWLADRAGSAMIVGAFAAGLMLHPLAHRTEIERNVTTLGYFFVPIFFASVGAAVDLNAMASRSLLAFGGALIVVAVLGKVVAGYAPWWFRGNKLLVGVAMVPRGEVGLIFAQMGLASGALTPALYGAVMMMVLATTLFTPPVLAAVARRREKSR